MIDVREDDRQYRRGMVLGLTMAEIMLLLIFLLMLLLFAKLLADRKEMEAAKAERDRAVASELATKLQLAALEEELAELRNTLPDYDIRKEYEKLKKELAQTRDQLERAEKTAALLAPVQEQAQAMSPGATPEEAIDNLMKAAEVGETILNTGKSPEELLAGASCQRTLDQCKASNVDLAAQLARKGGQHPSCWIDAVTGERQYIFDAFLRDDGIYLKDNKVPGREQDQARLPIHFEFGRPYSAGEFIRAGRDLLNWSRQQEPECRFWVRATDETSNDKELYVRLKEKGVEQIFYVYKRQGP